MVRVARFVGVGLLVLSGCGDPEPLAVNLGANAVFGGSPVTCGAGGEIGLGDSPVAVADARLFLSNLQARNQDGEWVALELEENTWQHEGIVLLDFEDSAESCADSGTPETNTRMVGSLPGDSVYDALRFDVGVPFDKNHVDSATAPSPLNTPGMFWVWQGGYKFVRVDLMTQGDTPARWNLHIGSTQCVSDAPTQAPAEACGRPNLATITLEGKDPTAEASTLDVDLGAFFGGVDVSVNTEETPPGCMSSPTEPDDCTPVYGALGLDFSTGACESDCAGQVVFR